MSFFTKRKKRKNLKKSLHKINDWQNAPILSQVIPVFFWRVKRASRPALPGNMTVEAAFVLPIFLFAMGNLMAVLLMFQTFSVQEGKLHQTGRELSMLAYGQEEGEQDIRLVTVSRIEAPFSVAAFGTASIANGCVMHKWIGYDLTQGGSDGEAGREEMVYVTKSGSAYHRERSCVYLNPSVKLMGISQAQASVNRNGVRYTACELCGGRAEVVYVTEDGVRYHSTINCSGLRRTIDYVTLQEALAAEKHACPKCG